MLILSIASESDGKPAEPVGSPSKKSWNRFLKSKYNNNSKYRLIFRRVLPLGDTFYILKLHYLFRFYHLRYIYLCGDNGSFSALIKSTMAVGTGKYGQDAVVCL